jgi:hypothetical protein
MGFIPLGINNVIRKPMFFGNAAAPRRANSSNPRGILSGAYFILHVTAPPAN